MEAVKFKCKIQGVRRKTFFFFLKKTTCVFSSCYYEWKLISLFHLLRAQHVSHVLPLAHLDPTKE